MALQQTLIMIIFKIFHPTGTDTWLFHVIIQPTRESLHS